MKIYLLLAILCTATATTCTSAGLLDAKSDSVAPQSETMTQRGVFFSKSGSRLALVIGNAEYPSSIWRLRNPVHDADDVAVALEKLRFKVIKKTNAGQLTMEKAIRDFGEMLRNYDIGLFYYAGHGMQINGQNYMIPIGNENAGQSEVEKKTINVEQVLSRMKKAENQMNIVILDACRVNPYARSPQSAIKGFAKVSGPKGSIIAYSAAPNEAASDGRGRNSPYTKALLEHINDPGIKIEEVFKRVGKSVLRDTAETQWPYLENSTIISFYFVPPELPPEVPPKLPPKVIDKPQIHSPDKSVLVLYSTRGLSEALEPNHRGVQTIIDKIQDMLRSYNYDVKVKDDIEGAGNIDLNRGPGADNSAMSLGKMAQADAIVLVTLTAGVSPTSDGEIIVLMQALIKSYDPTIKRLFANLEEHTKVLGRRGDYGINDAIARAAHNIGEKAVPKLVQKIKANLTASGTNVLLVTFIDLPQGRQNRVLDMLKENGFRLKIEQQYRNAMRLKLNTDSSMTEFQVAFREMCKRQGIRLTQIAAEGASITYSGK